jgi:hypothetical protein
VKQSNLKSSKNLKFLELFSLGEAHQSCFQLDEAKGIIFLTFSSPIKEKIKEKNTK